MRQDHDKDYSEKQNIWGKIPLGLHIIPFSTIHLKKKSNHGKKEMKTVEYSNLSHLWRRLIFGS